MAQATIPVDLFNPGQVFACLGLAETVLALTGEAALGFVGDGAATACVLTGGGEGDPVELALAFLAEAELHSLTADAEVDTSKWGVPTQAHPGGAFPFAPPNSPATLPARLSSPQGSVTVDHWGDSTRRDNTKFWAGSGGYPGAGLLRDAIELARPFLSTAHHDPFAVRAPQSSSFRFDWRRDYVPLGVGFSLNNHSGMNPFGYPLVEIFAAIGMSHARPKRPKRGDKLVYTYSVPMVEPLPLPLVRPIFGGSLLPFPIRSFRMSLDWPGQVGQARCITNVVEET